jgi:hypothetical protein
MKPDRGPHSPAAAGRRKEAIDMRTTSPCPLAVPSLLATAALAALLAVAPLACGGGEGAPVAKLSLEPGAVDLPYGSFTDLDLAWTPRAELEGVTGQLRLFAHLLDPKGRLTRTFDQGLPDDWQVGQSQHAKLRLYQSLLAPPLAAGDYTLTVGLYDDSGRRWPLDTEGERRGRDEYEMVAVHVPKKSAGLPAFEFSPTWSPTLAGSDRQVVAFRWLHGDGSIHLSEIQGPGTLWARIQIPAVETAGMRRQIEDSEGGDEARLGLSAGCSGFEAGVSGAGSHDIDIPVTTDSGRCTVTYDPNFVMIANDPAAVTDAGRTLLLEALAWKKGS